MRRLAALPPVLLAVLALTGCATGSSAPGSPAADDSSAGASAGNSAGASGACRSGQVTLTETDNRTQQCLAAGTLVEVYLHGQPGRTWSAPSSDSPALHPVASGKGALPVGVTGGFFRAERAGTAHLTASRPLYASPPPGGARCLALEEFTVTVEVR